MVLVRKDQVNSVDTKFSRFAYTANPGVLSTSIPAATLSPSLITQIPGGVEENTSATVIGSADPYPILPGDSFSISVDGGPVVPIIFTGTETTATRIAAVINAGVGFSVASYFNGALRIASTTTGPSSSILLADIVLATLAKMGLSAGLFVGGIAPTRGVITTTPQSLGGFVPLINSNGNDLVTDNPGLINISQAAGGIVSAPIQPGGSKIHGRISFFGSNYNISYYAFLAQKAQVTTFNSNFSLLDNTDSFTVSIDGDPVTVPFSGPGTRDQVVSIINSAWGVPRSSNIASVLGTVSQPYTFSNDQFTIAANGQAPVTITLSTAVITVAQIATLLNSTVGLVGQINAIPFTVGDNICLLVASTNTNSSVSSLEFRPVGQSLALHYLGIAPGIYRGSSIAAPVGASEISLNSFIRGSTSQIVISGPSQTLNRLGLIAGTYTATDDLVEETVALPTLQGSNLGTPSTSYQITALIPEAVRFGEIPPATDKIAQKYTDFSPGSNFDPRSNKTFFSILHNNSGYGKGINDSGKLVTLGSDGLIDIQYLRAATDESNKFFKKFIRGNYQLGEITSLVTTILETPGTNGNPVAKSPILTIDIDPDGSFPTSGQVNFRQGRDTISPVTFTSFLRDSGGPTTVPWRASGGAPGVLFAWGSDSGVTNFYDINTISTGVAAGGLQHVPLTDSTIAQNIRVMEAYSPGTSVFSAINARETVTCGDGTNSFGDFNGPNSLVLALNAFINVSTLSQIKIILKDGNFNVDTPVSFPLNKSAIIQGQGAGATRILLNNALIPPPQISWAGPGLEFRDIAVFSVDNTRSPAQILANAVSNEPGPFIATNSYFDNTCLSCTDNAIQLNKTLFNGGYITNDKALITISNSGNTPITSLCLARDCIFVSGQNNPVLRITTNGPFAPLTVIQKIEFDNCIMQLLSTTVDSNSNMVGNCGVVDVDPNGANALNSALATGVAVSHLKFKDCRVYANTAGGAVSVLMNLKPVGNGAFTPTHLYSYGFDPCIRIDNVTIEGGEWIIPAVNSVVSPFTICGVGVSIQNTGNTNGTLTIRDVLFNLSTNPAKNVANSAGGPTTDTYAHFTSLSGPSEYINNATYGTITQNWGAIALDAFNMNLQNVKIINASQNSGCGELLLKASNSLSVDDILITDYKPGGPGLTPSHRVRFRFGDPFAINTLNVSIKKLRVIGTDAASGGWTQITSPISGSNWSFPETGFIIATEPSAVPFVYDECEVRGFTVAGLADDNSSGFGLVLSTLGGLFGSGAGANLNLLDQIKISRFKSLGLFAGINFILGNSVFGFNWEVTECIIAFADNTGILITSQAQLGRLLFNKNRVSNNGAGNISGDNSGITFLSGSWPSLDSIICTDNISYDNNGNNQITFQTITGVTPNVILYGNQCSSNQVGSPIILQSIAIAGSGNSPISPFVPFIDRIRGFETSYPDNIGTRGYVNGAPMLHNLALLKTPIF